MTSSKNLIVPICFIHAFRKDNVARLAAVIYKDLRDKATLTTECYNGLVEVGGIMGLYLLDKEQVEEAVVEMQSTRNQLKANHEPLAGTIEGKKVVATPGEQLRAWEDIYMAEGKILKPKYGVVYHFRREGILKDVNALRLALNVELITEIPALVHEYESASERHAACIRENAIKQIGMWAPTQVDNLNASRTRFNEGARESDLQKEFGVGRGIGQKLYIVCMADHLYTDLKLVDRMLKGDLPMNVAAQKVRDLLVKKNGEYACKATKGEVETYFSNPNGGKTEPKQTDKKTIKSIAAQSNNAIVAGTCAAIIDNRLVDFNKGFSTEEIDKLNAIFEASAPGKAARAKINAELAKTSEKA